MIGRRSFACRWTVSVQQSSGCSTETGDDIAHFQATTRGLSVTHLMCRRTEETSTSARHICGVFFVILAPDTKLPTYLLTLASSSNRTIKRRRQCDQLTFVRELLFLFFLRLFSVLSTTFLSVPFVRRAV